MNKLLCVILALFGIIGMASQTGMVLFTPSLDGVVELSEIFTDVLDPRDIHNDVQFLQLMGQYFTTMLPFTVSGETIEINQGIHTVSMFEPYDYDENDNPSFYGTLQITWAYCDDEGYPLEGTEVYLYQFDNVSKVDAWLISRLAPASTYDADDNDSLVHQVKTLIQTIGRLFISPLTILANVLRMGFRIISIPLRLIWYIFDKAYVDVV